jgi:hypothetical protein
MEPSLVQFSLLITLLLTSLAVGSAVVSWRQASVVMRQKKLMSQLTTDILTLESESSRLKEMISRLSKRQSLADYKASVAEDGEQPDMFRRDKRPGPGATKQQLRDYWLKGKTHQQIAQLAQGGKE